MFPKLLFLSTIFLSTISANSLDAQGSKIKNGTLTYTVESKSKFDAIMDKLASNQEFNDSIATPEMESAMNFLKSSIKPVSFELKIQKNKSQFKITEELNPGFESNANMNRLLATTVGTIFINESDKYVFQVREFGGLEYFIDYTTEYFEWEITEDHKTIMGYDCIKATCKRLNPSDKNSPIIAWFTHDIQNSIGPAGYGGLPGMIMELTTNGLTTYTASDIYEPKSSTYTIEFPEPENTYDVQEFPAILKELLEEQRKFWGQ